MKELIGKTVKRLLVSENQWILAFDTDQGIVAYETDADCCSETWFADIVGVASLLGEMVLSAIKLNLPRECVQDGRSRQDYDMLYGWQLMTKRGKTEVIFRNSSNGYYGGRIGVYGGNLPVGMKEIIKDWQA